MKKLIQKGSASIAAFTLAFTLFSSSAFATAPEMEDVEYLGKGKVEVEFEGDVKYRNPEVTVKDTRGNTYEATIYQKDEDEVKFKVKNYKTNRRYSFTISGVKQRNTTNYGKVSGSFKIPSAKSNITSSKAISIALEDAGLTKSQVRDLEVEKESEDGVTFYEVTFESGDYEYEYEISLKGKILWKEKERD